MKTVNVKIQFKNGNKSVMQVPVKKLVSVMMPDYSGNIVELTPAAVKATVNYIEELTGEKPDKAVMYLVDLVEKDMTNMVAWTNGIRIVNHY